MCFIEEPCKTLIICRVAIQFTFPFFYFFRERNSVTSWEKPNAAGHMILGSESTFFHVSMSVPWFGDEFVIFSPTAFSELKQQEATPQVWMPCGEQNCRMLWDTACPTVPIPEAWKIPNHKSDSAKNPTYSQPTCTQGKKIATVVCFWRSDLSVCRLNCPWRENEAQMGPSYPEQTTPHKNLCNKVNFEFGR